MWNLKNKIKNEVEIDLQIHRTDCWLAKQRGLQDWVRRVERFRNTNRYLHNSHGDIKHSRGNRVSNIVITVYGARWVLEILGGSLYKVYDCLMTILYT